MSNILMILESYRRKGWVPSFGRKRKRIRGHDTGKEGGGIRDSLLSNDKNNVIAENVLRKWWT